MLDSESVNRGQEQMKKHSIKYHKKMIKGEGRNLGRGVLGIEFGDERCGSGTREVAFLLQQGDEA